MKSLKASIGLLSMFIVLAAPSMAKTALETQADANNEASKAMVKEDEAQTNSETSAVAQIKGQENRAAKHAKKAAIEQREADKITDKANHLQDKAEEKAVKESR